MAAPPAPEVTQRMPVSAIPRPVSRMRYVRMMSVPLYDVPGFWLVVRQELHLQHVLHNVKSRVSAFLALGCCIATPPRPRGLVRVSPLRPILRPQWQGRLTPTIPDAATAAATDGRSVPVAVVSTCSNR